MVFGFIPECCSDSFRNERSASPESSMIGSGKAANQIVQELHLSAKTVTGNRARQFGAGNEMRHKARVVVVSVRRDGQERRLAAEARVLNEDKRGKPRKTPGGAECSECNG
jgi:hypothetical protein